MTDKEKNKKVLGPSKYAGSKKKKEVKKDLKDPKTSRQNSDLKVKIKNLQKEIKRIEDSKIPDAKEKKFLESKLEKLIKVNKDIFKNIKNT